MRFWWANQKQTYDHEVPGGFLWSPKRKRDKRKPEGARNPYYDTMTQVSAGDIVLSFAGGKIKAIGIIMGAAISSEKPNFGSVGDQWHNDGWLVPVEFEEVVDPVRPKDFIGNLLPHFAPDYNPLTTSGNGKQNIYLAEINRGFINTIFREMGTTVEEVVREVISSPDEQDLAQVNEINDRTDIGETQKLQLVLARRGQGLFKTRVRLIESRCRVTGLAEPRLLIASHIKPWAKSSDHEKLDGSNGLLLSPHVDRLFDRGFISFSDKGDLLVSSKLRREVLEAWSLAEVANVGEFSIEQCKYLDYHRRKIFKAKA